MSRTGRAGFRWSIGVLLGALLWTLPPTQPTIAVAAAATDWPTYLQDPGRNGASSDPAFTPTTAAQLNRAWAFATMGILAASPTVVGGTVYVGSWDGFEYALDAATGQLKWKTFLGLTVGGPTCTQPPKAGVTSAATVQNGVVYVGGGDAYWYALDAGTGAVLWKVFTGDNSPAGGHYNWASPLIYNGYAYIGIASLGDCPLVQGQLLQVSLSTHQVTNTFNVVPNGQVGGGIWTSPAVDPGSNTVYVTTGTQAAPGQSLTQAMVALDATTLALKGSWAIPSTQLVPDADWGTTPIVFNDVNGRQLVAGTNKNGIVYAFDRNNVSAGPVWQRQIAVGGDCPLCADGSVSSGGFGNGRLYFAGGRTTINGAAAQGAVRALDPATGAIIWEHPETSPVLAAVAYVNGVLFAAPGWAVEALDAASGASLWSYGTGGRIYVAPSIAAGMMFTGSEDHNVYAFRLPASAYSDHFALSTTGSVTAGTSFSFTVSALDRFGSADPTYAGTVHFTSSDNGPGVWLPSDSTLTNGRGTFSATFQHSGQQTITATDAGSSSITGTLTVTVNPATGTRLLMSAGTAAPTAGVSFAVTVTALNPNGNTDPTYAGTLHFTSSDTSAGVLLPPDSTLPAGQGTFSATLDRAGPQTISATDTTKPSVTATVTVQVIPAGAATLSLTAPSTAKVGQAFNVTVTLTDRFGNVATGYRGTVRFRSSDTAARLPNDYGFWFGDNGAHTFSVTLMTGGSQTVTVTDTSNSTLNATSSPITVSLI
jgi:outer membrane protein assembly factor BamB